MKPKRVRPLSQAYHQLSRLLCETLLCMYASDVLPKHENPLQKAETVLSLYECQMAKEEELLLSFLHDYEPMITVTLRHNYKECRNQINSLRKMISASDADRNTDSSNMAKHDILYRFNEFLNTCTKQMQDHENLINPVWWRYYSDKELEQMASAFIIKQPSFTPHKIAVTKRTSYHMAV